MTGLGVVGLMVVVAQAGVPQDAPACEGGAAREMAGHVFIPSELTIEPFATTYFRQITGVARAEGTGPRILSTGEQTGSRTYNQLGLALSFELQVALSSWLTVRGSGNFLAYSGLYGGSALVLGQVVQYRLLLGATASKQIGDRIRVGVTLDGGPSPVYSVNFLDAVETAIQNRSIDQTSVTRKTTASVIIPGVAAAMTLHPSLGITGNILWEHPFGTTSGANVNGDSLIFATHLDFDSRPFWRVPVGAIGGYRLIVPIDAGKVRNDFALGVFYTGRRNLVLGFEGNLRKSSSERLSASTVYLGQLVFRYYW